MAVLLREAIGGSLRRVRTARRRTLREVSRRARVSLGYLSEVERGRKEPSSELLAAICEALEIEVAELLADAAERMWAAAAVDRATGAGSLVQPIGLRHTSLRLADAGGSAGLERPAVPAGGVRAAA